MRQLDRLIMNALDELDAFDDNFADDFGILLDNAIDTAIGAGANIRPGTKCTESEHNKYYGRVNSACKTPGRSFSCTGTDTIDQLFAKSAIAMGCATARQAYQRRCFDRSHPRWQRHEIERNQAERASRRCWEEGRRKQSRERTQRAMSDAGGFRSTELRQRIGQSLATTGTQRPASFVQRGSRRHRANQFDDFYELFMDSY